MRNFKDFLFTMGNVLFYVLLCVAALFSIILSIEVVRSFRGN